VLPVPGWTGEWDWRGYQPFDAHPVVRNPATGYVVTANNRQAAGAAADNISSFWEQPYRAARIRAMVLATEQATADAVHGMQHDVHDALAARYRDSAVRAAERAERPAAARTLAAWDLRAARDSHGAALFYAWYETMNRMLSAVLYDGGEPGPLPRAALDAMLDANALFWGDTTAAAFDRLAADAMIAADSLAAGRTWGDLHLVRSAHALSVSALLERIFRLDVGPLPGDGSPTTVSVSDFAPGTVPVLAAYGPSQRHVVDMADVDGTGGFILPTGQSGIPFSRHYRDQFERWRNGGLWRIPLDRLQADARTVHRLSLQPAR
jgi:penicillin amidase